MKMWKNILGKYLFVKLFDSINLLLGCCILWFQFQELYQILQAKFVLLQHLEQLYIIKQLALCVQQSHADT